MKHCVALLFYCCITLVLPAQNVADLESFEKAIQAGTVLSYDVSAAGGTYQLIATIKKTGDEIIFDWSIPKQEAKKGTVAMSAEAVTKANALLSAFTTGEVLLKSETALLISRKIFNDISSTSSAAIKLRGTSDTATVLNNTISEFNFNLNGNLVAIPGWELQNEGEVKFTLDVLESYKFPLIFRLDAGIVMQLTEIKSP